MSFPVDLVIVWKGDIERILLRAKCSRPIAVCACRWVGVIITAKIHLPFSVPRTCVVWGGVSRSRFLSDPEHGGGDVLFPRVGLLLKWVFRSGWRRESLSRCDTGECAKK